MAGPHASTGLWSRLCSWPMRIFTDQQRVDAAPCFGDLLQPCQGRKNHIKKKTKPTPQKKKKTKTERCDSNKCDVALESAYLPARAMACG